jgi:hypothetical protein
MEAIHRTFSSEFKFLLKIYIYEKFKNEKNQAQGYVFLTVS